MTELQLLSDSIVDLKWFKENSHKIREDYEGEFVAIKGKRIIDSASTAVILIKKLERRGGDSNLVLIKHITPKGEIVIL